MRLSSFARVVLPFLFVASGASAETWYVSPTGTAESGCTERWGPCSLPAAAAGAVAGDTVVLMDGVYTESLYVANSGTPTDWITFEADECATPILEGPGDGPDAEEDSSSGVNSAAAEYVRFRGIVARGWNIGFGNGWVGGVDTEDVSNGHWEIEYCASYSNGRTGFTFFSAEHFQIRHSISAHNGTSRLHSWSSGITLFEATGAENLVEGCVSFENSDAQNNTDGSGFIVDEDSNGATFVNNLAFGNGGSCLRLTKSSGTRFINNTCYLNSQFGDRATGPTNPSELYFTNGGVTVENVTFMNNLIVGTGQAPAGAMPVVNQPESGWTNNFVTTGQVSFFADAAGANPSFVPAAGASEVLGQGATGDGVPTQDIGFDPKCIVKQAPVMVGDIAAESWWQYDVDIAYIQSIGGVAACFNPRPRSGAADLGAYGAGDVTTVAPGSCVPPEIGTPPPMAGAGGGGAVGSMGGAVGSMGGAVGSMGGAVGSMGGAVGIGSGGVTTGGGGPAVGDPATATGSNAAGNVGAVDVATTGGAGAPSMDVGAQAGSASGVGGPAATGTPVTGAATGSSGCTVRAPSTPSMSLLAAGAFVLLVGARRRRGRA